MSNQIDSEEEEEGEYVEPVFFDHEQRYTDEVVPRLEELTALLKEIGIDYVIQLCYSHDHPSEGVCNRGVAMLVDIDAAKSPVSMAASSVIAQMSPSDAYRVMRIAQATQVFIEKVQSGEIVIPDSDEDSDPWQAAAPMN